MSDLTSDIMRGSQGGKKILIVEDEPSVLSLMARVLRGEGYEVAETRNGWEALDRMRETVFDCVICDVRMTDLDGKAFYEEVKKRQYELAERMVFVTGDTVSLDIRGFLEETGAPYLLKPFSLSDLKKMVEVLFQREEEERGKNHRSDECQP